MVADAGDEFFAYQAFCPHEDVPLADGIHDGRILTCLEHMWQFDMRTGEPRADAEAGLTQYRLSRRPATSTCGWSRGADAMKGSRDHILTSHAGSLPRPDELIEANRARESGEATDERRFQAQLQARASPTSCVGRRQAGIAIAGDGEFGKSMGHA